MTLRTLSFSLLLSLSLAASACATGYEDDYALGEQRSEAGVRGTFDLWQGADGQYYFHLESGNHQILLSSEGYTSRTGALNGILSVLDNGGLEQRYQIKTGVDGLSYVSLAARNGEIIAVGEGYASAANARRAVKASIRAVASYLEYWDTAIGARFDVFEGRDRRFYFNLHAKNGAIVLTSQAYQTEASALNGAFSVAENGVDPEAYDLREAANGGYYFNLHAANHQIIGTSQVYSTRSNAVRARDAVVALLPDVDLL